MNSKPKPYRVGKWLPSDQKFIDEWLHKLFQEVETKYRDQLARLLKRHPPAEDVDSAKCHKHHHQDISQNDLGLHPPVEALMNAILTDPEINILFHQMFWQQRDLPITVEGKKICCWQVVILLINITMTRAPEFNKSGFVGLPINVILNWPMVTTAGLAAFLNDKVNRYFKDILNYWGEFLSSPESTYVLTDDPRSGWFGEDAMAKMPNFVKEFKCDPKKPHYGFKSWDDFFVREYRHGIRPVAAPDDDNVIANACESAPYKLANDVRKRDYFWIKSQRYSLDHMLNHHRLAEEFYGGTVYQAYLSATSYHRWHSPVSGMVLHTELVDGSYYSQTFTNRDYPVSQSESQGYISHVAARGIIYFIADNPAIGLMAFVSVGMGEVSSNQITVKTGDRVKKGQEIGMFHFGGSTHCLLFRPGVELEFDLHGQTPGLESDNIPVRSRIATVIHQSNQGKNGLDLIY